MGSDALGHAEAADLLRAEDLGHLLVGDEVLLVLGILQVVLLDVGPEELHELGAGRLLLADEIGELGAELLGLGESSSSGHDVDLGMGLRAWESSGLTSRAVKMKLRLERCSQLYQILFRDSRIRFYIF